MHRRALVAAVIMLPAGCGGGATERSAAGSPAVRDSAGVAIVENGVLPTAVGTWMGGAALLDLGGDEAGGEPFEHIVAIAILNGDGLAIADAGSSVLRLYSGDGQPLASLGGPGEGPGEYRQIDAMGRAPGDSLWVYDFGLRRLTLLAAASRDHDGASRSFTLGAALSAVSAAGMLADGGLVVREHWSSALGGAARGPRREPVAIAVVDRTGTLVDTIALVPGREVVIAMEDGRRTMTTPPWSRTSSVAVFGTRVFAGDQDQPEIRLYDGAGRLERIVRWTAPSAGSAHAWADSLAATVVAKSAPSDRASRQTWLDRLPRPDIRPTHGRILATINGEFWVAPWVAADEAEPRWFVFDESGRFQAVMELPRRFRLLHVDADRLIGVARDSDDVERVRVHARPPLTGAERQGRGNTATGGS
jgi:hypothetical protein